MLYFAGPELPVRSGFLFYIYLWKKYFTEKVIFFIDGFNLYHSIANKRFNKYKWIDLSELAKNFITKKEHIEEIYYFTALTPWSPDKKNRHKIFIKVQELKGIKIVYGEFRKKIEYADYVKKHIQHSKRKELMLTSQFIYSN